MNKIIKYAGLMIGGLASLVAADNAFAWLHFDTRDLNSGDFAVRYDSIGHGYKGTPISAAYMFNAKRAKKGLPPLKGEKLLNELFDKSNCREHHGREICDYTWKKDNFKGEDYLEAFKEADINPKDHVITPKEAEDYYHIFR